MRWFYIGTDAQSKSVHSQICQLWHPSGHLLFRMVLLEEGGAAQRERERVILECFPNQGLSLDFLFSFRWAYGTMGCGGIYLVCVESTSPLGKSWSSI